MEGKNSKQTFEGLRQEAEKYLSKKTGDLSRKTPENSDNLLYELEVHQAELEIQNEELRNVQLELHQSRDRYLNLYEYAPIGYFTLDRDSHILEVNLTGAVMLGKPRGHLLKAEFTRFVAPDSQDTFHFHLQKVLEEGQRQNCELRIMKRDGTLISVLVSSIARADAEGKLTQCFSTITDITRDKQSEALQNALHESQQREAEVGALLSISRAVLEYREFPKVARAIFDSCKKLLGASAGYVALLNEAGSENQVLFLDSGGRPCAVDPSLPMPIRGLRAEAYRKCQTVYDNSFPQSKWMDFIPEQHVKLDNVLFAPLSIDGRAIGLIGLANKPGGFTENDARLATAFADIASVALSNSRNLELLENSEERFRSIFETSPIGIEFYNPEGKLITANKACLEIFGISEMAEVKGFLLFNEPNLSLESREKLRDGETVRYEAPFDFNEVQEDNLYRTSKSGIIWLDVMLIPVLDNKDLVCGYLVQVQDITERKLAEEKINNLNASLVRHASEVEAANKELESFSYSVSHDLRAPLRSIDGFSQAILEDYSDKLDPQGREYLQRIRTSSQLMAQLIDDILNLSRITCTEIHLEKVNLSELAQEVAVELRRLQPERRVEFSITPDLEAYGDSHLLKLVFDNLLGNAFKFTGKRPLAKIEFGVTQYSGEPANFVRDNGAGFDMKYADKLFKPFQRLHSKEEFPGTGIGLASVQNIIRRLGGKVWAESQKDEGAAFYFTLPQISSKD